MRPSRKEANEALEVLKQKYQKSSVSKKNEREHEAWITLEFFIYPEKDLPPSMRRRRG